jgi:HrpA-like RNA helicase
MASLPPTLLRKGFVVPPEGSTPLEIKRIENTISIDYVLNFIANRVSLKRGSRPKIVPKKPGDKVIVLKSDTGSGKSTVLPPKLYTTFFEGNKKNIAVTQPRILTAMDLPNTIVPYTNELELDKNIGYNTGKFKRLPKERGIIFSTVGVLTQQLIMNTHDEFMKKYQFIIIDEVHERDIDTDLCLFMLKKLLEVNFDNIECPLLILTSATFNEEIFINYFDVPKENYIQIVGSTFPIKPNFPDYSIANYVQFATLKAQKLHIENINDVKNREKSRDIIIFVKDSGVGKKIYADMHLFNSKVLDNNFAKIIEYGSEISAKLENLYKKGGKSESKESDRYYILPILLDSVNFQSGGLEYQNLFSTFESINVPLWKLDDRNTIDTTKPPNDYVMPTRRIIIATNVAETGVTIDTLKYCVDTGYHFNVEFNPEVGCSVLYAKNVTKGMAIQRRGRVGRKAPGFWYPCYTEETFNSMPIEQSSKIIVSDTTENLLSIMIKEKNVEVIEEDSIRKIKNYKKENLFYMFKLTSNTLYKTRNLLQTNLSSLDFIEMPSMQSLCNSIEKLHILGFIDDSYNVTTTGFFANQIRFISLELRKMILAGFYYGANILDLITIAAFVYTTKRKIFAKDFKMQNFLKQTEIEFNFYNKILFADDFVNCVFVWNIFQSFVQKSLSNLSSDVLETMNNSETTEYKNILYTDTIKKWCSDNGIIYDGLLNVIATRDQLIENILTAGINPYKNSLGLPKNSYNLNKIVLNSLAEGIEEIKKIKESLYEGFKCNLLINRKNTYFSLLHGITVKIKSPLVAELEAGSGAEQTKPMHILVDSYSLSQKFGASQFEFLAEGYVCVLDNFVEVDELFYLH